jgi:hypothetical protein
MLSRLGRRLTFANVVAVIALFLALGGAGVAAVSATSPSSTLLDYNASAVASPTFKSIGKMGPYALKARCGLDSGTGTVTLTVEYTGPASAVDQFGSTSQYGSNNSIEGLPAAKNGTYVIDQATGVQTNLFGFSNTFVPHKGKPFLAVTNWAASANTKRCHFSAAITPLKRVS